MINYPKSVFFYFWSENPPKFANIIVKNMTLLLVPYSLKNVEIIQKMQFFKFWSENPPKFAKIVKNMTLLLLCPYSLKNVEIIQIMQFLKFLVRKSPKICKHFEKYVIVVKNVLVVIFLPKI